MNWNEFIDQLSHMTAPEILEIVVSWTLRVVFGFFAILAARYGMKIKKEVDTMNDQIKDQPKKKRFSKKYSGLVKEYAYDEKTDTLKETGGYIDVDEKIQSYVGTCFEAILEKFLPNEDLSKYIAPITDDQFGDKEYYLDPLDDLTEAKNYFLELREKYGLDDELTDMQVYEKVCDMAKDASAKLKKYEQKVEEPKQDVKKEDVKADPQIDVEEAIAFYKANHKEA